MMQKRRILMIASTPLFSDGLTKIEMDIIDYNKGVIDFEVACGFGFDNDYGRKLKNQGITCHLLPPKKHIFHYMKAIRKLIRFQRYDAVYIHGNSAMMFLEAIPAKLAGTRVITHCHNTKSDFPVIHYIMKPFFNMAVDQKIGCSKLASKWAYCGKNIITIPNGVDIERFSFDGKKRETVRKELGWEDKKIIGHIGRFNKQKNHEKLIDIFDKALEKDHDVRLLLIGDGELKTKVSTYIKDKDLEQYVKILPSTNKPEDYIQAMDIMVLPSLFEGFCLVAVEAQANGIPVLIDDQFPHEAKATTQARKIDLLLSDEEWAQNTIELIKVGRKKVKEQIIEKELDQQTMMRKVQSILLK